MLYFMTYDVIITYTMTTSEIQSMPQTTTLGKHSLVQIVFVFMIQVNFSIR